VRAVVVALALCGCSVQAPYPCTSSDMCVRAGTQGYCEAAGYCSFDATDCASQRRFDASASDALASTCVTGITTGRDVQHYATNDASFEPVVTTRGIPGITPTATLLDGTVEPVTYSDRDGSFSFPNPDGQPYDLQLDGTLFQFDLPHVELVEHLAGRPDRTPITKPTQVHFQYQSTAPGNDTIASTGVWTETPMANGNNVITFDWKSAVSLSGSNGLLDASKNDQLFFTKVSQQTGYTTITAYATATPTLADGTMATIPSATLTVPLLDQCVHVVAPEMSTYARITSALPMGNYSSQQSWTVIAVPSLDETGVVGALVIATGTDAGLVDVDKTITLHDPYPGTTLLGKLEVNALFTLSQGGIDGSGSVINGFTIWAPFASTGACATDTATLAPTIGLPGPLSVGGTQITSHEQHVTADLTQRVMLSWGYVVPGPVDLTEVQLVELSNDGTSLAVDLRFDEYTATASLSIDPTLLVKGHTYIVHLVSHASAANAAAGDFVTPAVPIETSSAWSESFTVM
jgi:hypothetical protein